MEQSAPVSIGEVLRRYRMEAGLTQEALADRAGVSARAVRAIEGGTRQTPRKETLSLLAEALGLSPTERARLEAMAQQRRATLARVGAVPPLRVQERRPLVGREGELAALDAFLSSSAPPCLFLAGEPGIGKTRLLEEGLARASALDWTVIAGGCQRRSALEPYAPCADALAHFIAPRSPERLRRDLQGCGWLVRLLPELADLAALPTPAWTMASDQERRLMFAAVARFLENVGGHSGTLLVLDDLQWAGADALDLIGFLVRGAGDYRVRVLGAYRDTEVTQGDPLLLLLGDLARVRSVVVAPLAALVPEAAERLLADALGEGAAPDQGAPAALAGTVSTDAGITRQILARAGGVPYYILSCAQEASQSGPSASPEALAVPWSVATSIQQRIALLAPPAEEVLTVAAIAEGALSRPVLLAVLAEQSVSRKVAIPAVEATVRARLLRETEEGAYRFVHDLIRETVAATLSGARRMTVHSQVAEVLERQPDADRNAAKIAWHFAQGNDLARALPYALRAADQAEAVYAYGEAEAHCRDAIAWARALGDQECEAEALEKLADALFRLARFNEVGECLAQAAAIYRALRLWDRLAWVTTLLARAHYPLGRLDEAMGQVEEVLALAAASGDLKHQEASAPSMPTEEGAIVEQVAGYFSPRTAAGIYILWSGTLMAEKRYDECARVTERAIEYARAAGEYRLESLGYTTRAHLHLARAETAEAATWLARARECARAHGDLQSLHDALVVMGWLHETRAEPKAARAVYQEMYEIGTQVGDIGFVGATLCTLAAFCFLRGEWAEAQRMLERALGVLSKGEVLGLAPEGGLALLALARGTMDASTTAKLESLGLAFERTEDHLSALAITLLGEHDILTGQPAHARDWLRRSAESASTKIQESGVLLPVLAWAELALGNLETARALLANVNAQQGPYSYLAALDCDRVAALLALREGRIEEARAAAVRSVERARAFGFPYAEVKALFVLGQVFAEQGHADEAREAFTTALAICDRLGEGLYRPHIVRALDALGSTGL